ncbi:MAG: rhodanese-like domain-containing protein [Nitrospinota bacterium]|nr:rhodanese-like domain-containing protein [Nitrospinota bacterium]
MTVAIQPINPPELKERLDSGQVGLLLDVRDDWEYSMAAIEGATHIPLGELVDRLQELAFEDDIVVYCHFGQRSYQAGLILKEAGFNNVFNLVGGIDAWSQLVDPSIRRYRAPF